MKILAIDVGMGTQDILLYDSTQRTENCIKMVFPSQTRVNAKQIVLCDVDTTALGSALELFDTLLPRDFAVAVQDHGEAPDMSNRIFRFEHFKKILMDGGMFDQFAYMNHVPEHLSRMHSVIQTLQARSNNVLVMDTGPAAICGALNSHRYRTEQTNHGKIGSRCRVRSTIW
jgi:uncharacterized protein (DUF1786 family)